MQKRGHVGQRNENGDRTNKGGYFLRLLIGHTGRLTQIHQQVDQAFCYHLTVL
ncbi:MAG: hypothetical protein ACOX1A_09295 [Saccharofermentanales bacterium]